MSLEVPGVILSCGHGFHMECLAQANQKCPYCYEYLRDGIKYHCTIFQNMLSKVIDDNIDEDGENLENQEDPQEGNDDETITVEEDIDKKLEEALLSFRIFVMEF